ncbi:MAG: hypothetical protein O7C63_04425, partial [Alphaproteobacteria bacterium]|nr:hypothetical protein [Alphaproteobacteria bacterium]
MSADSTNQATIEIADLIARFGGIPALAKELSVPVSTVQNWVLRNAVPVDQVAVLRSMAVELEIELGPIPQDAPDGEAEAAGALVPASEPAPVKSPEPVLVPASQLPSVPPAASQVAPETASDDKSGGISAWVAGLFKARDGARPITMIALFAGLMIAGGFAWNAVLSDRAARQEAEAPAAAAADAAEAAAAEPTEVATAPEPAPDPIDEPTDEVVPEPAPGVVAETDANAVEEIPAEEVAAVDSGADPGTEAEAAPDDESVD